jgi:hypothetical protein
MISPKTSITGVNKIVASTGAHAPSTGRRVHVKAEPATMWDIVTPIIAVESARSGWRNASR